MPQYTTISRTIFTVQGVHITISVGLLTTKNGKSSGQKEFQSNFLSMYQLNCKNSDTFVYSLSKWRTHFGRMGDIRKESHYCISSIKIYQIISEPKSLRKRWCLSSTTVLVLYCTLYISPITNCTNSK